MFNLIFLFIATIIFLLMALCWDDIHGVLVLNETQLPEMFIATVIPSLENGTTCVVKLCCLLQHLIRISKYFIVTSYNSVMCLFALLYICVDRCYLISVVICKGKETSVFVYISLRHFQWLHVIVFKYRY